MAAAQARRFSGRWHDRLQEVCSISCSPLHYNATRLTVREVAQQVVVHGVSQVLQQVLQQPRQRAAGECGVGVGVAGTSCGPEWHEAVLQTVAQTTTRPPCTPRTAHPLPRTWKGPLPVITAWAPKPSMASMARRPFRISLVFSLYISASVLPRLNMLKNWPPAINIIQKKGRQGQGEEG